MHVSTQVFFEDIKENVVRLLKSANEEVLVAVAWITDPTLINTLTNLQKNGVQVSLIFYKDHINDAEKFRRMFKAGASVKYTTKLMHNKFCIIDRKIVINGSYNWTDNAERNNLENIQVTQSLDIVDQFAEEFEKIIAYSKDALKSHSDVEREIQEIYHNWYEYGRVFNDEDWTPCIMYVQKDIRSSFHKSHFIKLGDSFYLQKAHYKFPVIESGYYVLQTKEEANNYSYQLIFLQKEYSLTLVERVVGRKFNIPRRMKQVDGLEHDDKEQSFSLVDKEFYGTMVLYDLNFEKSQEKRCLILEDGYKFIE